MRPSGKLGGRSRYAPSAMTGFILEIVLLVLVAFFLLMVATGVFVALILGLTTGVAGLIRFLMPRHRRHSHGRGVPR
jgi:hypothetical protein